MGSSKLVADTSIFIEFLRAGNKKKTTLFKYQKKYEFLTPSITLYELWMGAKNDDKIKDLNLILEPIVILPFDRDAGELAGKIYQNLRKANKMIEFSDIFIGAIAVNNSLPMLTLNVKHFERIEGLNLV